MQSSLILNPIRQPLPGDLQAWFDARTGLLFIDTRVPLAPHPAYCAILAQVQNELLGNHDLAPNVWRPRPDLRLVVDDGHAEPA